MASWLVLTRSIRPVLLMNAAKTKILRLIDSITFGLEYQTS